MAYRYALALFCSAFCAFGQQAWPVGQLKVEGNKLYSDEQILAVANLKVGQMAGKREFDAAQERLLASGAFETVGYNFNPIPGQRANLGIFTVSEITQVFPYRFEELHVEDAAVRAHLKGNLPLLGDKVPATKPVLERMTRAVAEFTKNADVIGRLEGTSELTLVFRPSSLPSVAQVTFAGNKAIPTQKLQQAISGAGVGAVYTESRFRHILDLSVRQSYEALGYLNVQFPEIEVTPAPDVKGVALNVHVAEGDVYKLGDVRVTGEHAENSKELVKTGGFEPGEVANFEKIKAGVENIRKALRRNGYIEAKLTTDRKLDHAKKTVDIALDVDPGTQLTMGKLTIEGLDLETEPHIRKLWALKRGQPFNVEYPDYFLERLVSDQVMDNLGKTSSDATPNSDGKTVDVTIKLAPEKSPAKPPAP